MHRLSNSDGNQQPQGGVKSEHGDGVTTRVSPAGHAEGDAQKQHTGVKPGAVGESPALRASSVAEGGSVQCDGVALEQLLGWVEAEAERTDADFEAARTKDWRIHDRSRREALAWVARRIRKLLTQQSSGGQEGGVEDA